MKVDGINFITQDRLPFSYYLLLQHGCITTALSGHCVRPRSVSGSSTRWVVARKHSDGQVAVMPISSGTSSITTIRSA